MELVQLDQTTFTETGRFDKTSMIAWNLKWPKGGDFQARTYDVAHVFELFGKGDVIGNSRDFTVMQITEMSLSLDSKGEQYVEIIGESPLSIFDYRPAVPKIVSTTSYDAEYPDGWEYGDKLENTADVDPLYVAKDVIQAVDVLHYGQGALSYLSLPFTYVDTTFRVLYGAGNVFPWENYAYYQPSGTVGDVLDELCNKGEFGMVVVRPDNISGIYVPTPERPLGVVFYRPLQQPTISQKVSFSYLYNDLMSSNVSMRLINNVYIEPREDYVATTKTGQQSLAGHYTPASGLTARVDYQTRNIEGLDGYAYDNVNNDLIWKASEGESELADVSVETNGVFPFSPKYFQLNSEPPGYFLGDQVTVFAAGTRAVLSFRVGSFVRTQDMNGYREYPEMIDDKYDKFVWYQRGLQSYNWN